MKFYLFTIWFLFSGPALSREVSWSPLEKAGTSMPAYSSKSRCETAEAPLECFDTSGKELAYHDVQTVEVDDLEKPIEKAPYNMGSCDSPPDCQSQIDGLASNYCQSGDRVVSEKSSFVPGYKYFCTGITGYSKKTVKTLVLNGAKQSAFEANAALKAAQDALIADYRKDVYFGEKMVGFIAIRSRAKNLTTEQKKQMFTDYRAIIDLLKAGAIADAKSEIEALAVNAPLVTQADKDAVVAEITSYLGN